METINWALVGVIIIIGGCAWKGKRAGLIRAAFSATSTILSIIGAVILGPVVRTMFPNSPIFSYILAFIVASIGLTVVCNILDIVAKLPVLRQINESAGFLVGIVQGILYVWIGFIIIDLFAQTEMGTLLLNMIHSSTIVKTLYENNFLYVVWSIF